MKSSKLNAGDFAGDLLKDYEETGNRLTNYSRLKLIGMIAAGLEKFCKNEPWNDRRTGKLKPGHIHHKGRRKDDLCFFGVPPPFFIPPLNPLGDAAEVLKRYDLFKDWSKVKWTMDQSIIDAINGGKKVLKYKVGDAETFTGHDAVISEVFPEAMYGRFKHFGSGQWVACKWRIDGSPDGSSSINTPSILPNVLPEKIKAMGANVESCSGGIKICTLSRSDDERLISGGKWNITFERA